MQVNGGRARTSRRKDGGRSPRQDFLAPQALHDARGLGWPLQPTWPPSGGTQLRMQHRGERSGALGARRAGGYPRGAVPPSVPFKQCEAPLEAPLAQLCWVWQHATSMWARCSTPRPAENSHPGLHGRPEVAPPLGRTAG